MIITRNLYNSRPIQCFYDMVLIEIFVFTVFDKIGLVIVLKKHLFHHKHSSLKLSSIDCSNRAIIKNN